MMVNLEFHVEGLVVLQYKFDRLCLPHGELAHIDQLFQEVVRFQLEIGPGALAAEV